MLAYQIKSLEFKLRLQQFDERERALANFEAWNQPYPNWTSSHLMRHIVEPELSESEDQIPDLEEQPNA